MEDNNNVKNLVLMLLLFLIITGPSGKAESGEEKDTLGYQGMIGKQLVGADEWMEPRRVKPPSPPPPLNRLPTRYYGQASLSPPPPIVMLN